MNTEHTNTFKPLHTTVSEAVQGDAGWVYYKGDWRLAQVTRGDQPDDDALYLDVVFVADKSRWFEFDDETIQKLPWVPISRPPYEGDEKPCTHILHLQNWAGSATLSFRMDEDKGRDFDKKVFGFARSLLEGEPA